MTAPLSPESSGLARNCTASGCRSSRRFATASSMRLRCGGWCAITRRLPIDGLILAATSGEGLTLGMAELEWIVAVTRETLAKRRRYLPICLGLAGSYTRKLCHTLDETAGWPIDGYLISSPYYSRPSQRGLLQHFTMLADHASWPIVLYNIPYRAAVTLETETLLELASHPNIVGMKDCGANRAQSIELLRRQAGRLSYPDRRGRAVFRSAGRRR